MKKMTMSVLMILPVILAGCSSKALTYEENSYVAPVAEVQTITIDVKDRKIEIFESKDEAIHISYNESEKEFYKINLSDEKELSMVVANNKDWKDYIGQKTTKEARTIQVGLPNSSIENLTLKTSNEAISLPPLSITGAVNLKVNNGDIKLDKLTIGRTLTLETKNANISGSIVGALDDFSISSKVKKGKSNLPENQKNGDKVLDVSINNGDINLEFTE